MEEEKIRKSLTESIFDVLENMFFLPVQQSNQHMSLSDWFRKEEKLVGSELRFSGPSNGRFFLMIPLEEAQEASATFLGIEKDDVTQDQREDTIKEMLNMIGGRTLSGFDKEGVFHLELPEYVGDDPLMALKDRDEAIFILLETDKSHLAAGVIFEK
jgi:CheY-specific phosphatase CheX